jgi:hypothetical protein
VIAFATLLLGLIVGPQPVEVLVGESVAAVEVLLDGRRIGEMRSPDWSLICDFGDELEPHELVAVAFDNDRREVARARQWVNLPRHPAEASVALEGALDGAGVFARLSWESVVGPQPQSVRATLDGRPLRVDDPRRIALPAFDPDRLHHFRAELHFPGNVSSIVEAIFGGSFVDRVATELTAVPVILAGEQLKTPSLAQLQGRFSGNGRSLSVVALEEGPSEIVVVRDESARRDLTSFLKQNDTTLRRRARGFKARSRRTMRSMLPLPEHLRIRFLWPAAEHRERSGHDLDVFPPSAELSGEDGGFYWLLTYAREPTVGAEPRRFADAVAAAGLVAAARNRRRAIVLLLGDEGGSADHSRFAVGAVRRYLRHLGVPLVVWTTGSVEKLPTAWGPAVDVSSLDRLQRAAEALYEETSRQRIVWLAGRHLPQTVSLESAGLEIRLAGRL